MASSSMMKGPFSKCKLMSCDLKKILIWLYKKKFTLTAKIAVVKLDWTFFKYKSNQLVGITI